MSRPVEELEVPVSEADLRLVVKCIRHERAQRVYDSRRRGHAPRGLGQLHRLERFFVSLADRRKGAP